MLVVFCVKSKIELLFYLSSDRAKVDCSVKEKKKKKKKSKNDYSHAKQSMANYVEIDKFKINISSSFNK